MFPRLVCFCSIDALLAALLLQLDELELLEEAAWLVELRLLRWFVANSRTRLRPARAIRSAQDNSAIRLQAMGRNTAMSNALRNAAVRRRHTRGTTQALKCFLGD